MTTNGVTPNVFTDWYGNNPLWLTSDGLHKVRTKALTDAILNANADGMRLDDYPIGALATKSTLGKGSEFVLSLPRA